MKITLPFLFKIFFISFLLITASASAQSVHEYDTTKPADSIRSHSLEEVVISASRTLESILKSPVTIESVNNTFLRNTASQSFFDGLENVKGSYRR